VFCEQHRDQWGSKTPRSRGENLFFHQVPQLRQVSRFRQGLKKTRRHGRSSEVAGSFQTQVHPSGATLAKRPYSDAFPVPPLVRIQQHPDIEKGKKSLFEPMSTRLVQADVK